MPHITPKTTRIHASSVRVSSLGDGVLEVAYTGPMPQDNFTALRSHVMSVAGSASALVIRLDRMLMLMPLPYVEARPDLVMESPPGAFVVLPEQADAWREYSRKLSERGVMRAVFLPDQVGLARQWAKLHAAVRL